MVSRARRAPMKWSGGKPRYPGKAEGTIFGVPFSIEIWTEALHKQQTMWSMSVDIYGERYTSRGRSGGVQRALSCLRDDLESVCREHGVTE
jgi:hypothetical protein